MPDGENGVSVIVTHQYAQVRHARGKLHEFFEMSSDYCLYALENNTVFART